MMCAAEFDSADGARRQQTGAASARPGGPLVVPTATVLLDRDSRILNWSDVAERVLGYPPDEAVGRRAVDLLVTGERRAEARELFDLVARGGNWSGVFPMRHRDGHEVDIEFRNQPVIGPDQQPMVLALAMDVGAIRQVEADLAVLDAFFAQAPIGMAVYDTDLRFVRVNEALARMSGSRRQPLGRRLSQVVPQEAALEIEAVMREVLDTGRPVIDSRWYGRIPGAPGRVHAWSASYFRLQDPTGRILGVCSSVIDITDRFEADARAARAHERLGLLVEATATIGTTLDPHQTARELAEVIVPKLADVSAVLALQDPMSGQDGEPAAGPQPVRLLAGAAADQDSPLRGVELDAQLCPIPAGSPYEEALTTGRTTDVAWPMADPSRVPGNARLQDYLRSSAWHARVTPLVARGRVLGLVFYARKSTREPFEEADTTLADELAARAAVSLDNAALYTREHSMAEARRQALQQAQAAQARLALLNEAGSRIGGTLDAQRTSQELVALAVPRFADLASVDLLDPALGGAEPAAVPFEEPAIVPPEEPAAVPREGPVPLRAVAVGCSGPAAGLIAGTAGGTTAYDAATVYAQSLRTGRPVLVADVDRETLARIMPTPDQVTRAMAAGVRSYLVVPLLARGAVLGGAAFTRLGGGEPFGPEDLALAEELVSRAAVSIDNARLYRRERATALTLQRSLLPQDVPPALGLRTAHRYLPSSQAGEVGGDWFDVVPLSCSRVALLVGDVMGHGIRAAATMGQLRTVARTLAILDMPPEQLLTRLDETASAIGEGQFATCVCAVYDPLEHSCTLASAGHLPPVVAAPDGTSRLLDAPSALPLGVGGAVFGSVDFPLPQGSVLALYTDGLVERRGQDIDEGIGLLRRIMAHGRDSLEETCDAVLDAMVHGGPEDDIAVIMAQATAVPADRIATLPLHRRPTAAGEARDFTRRTLRAWQLTALSDSAQQVVGELVANALRHAGEPRQLRLIHDRVLTIEVADLGYHPPRPHRPAAYDEGGRGLHLVSELAHRWGSRATAAGKVVWAELELPPDRA